MNEETQPIISSLNHVIGQTRAVTCCGRLLMRTSTTASRPEAR